MYRVAIPHTCRPQVAFGPLGRIYIYPYTCLHPQVRVLAWPLLFLLWFVTNHPWIVVFLVRYLVITPRMGSSSCWCGPSDQLTPNP